MSSHTVWKDRAARLSDDELKRELCEVFSRYPEVLAVYLFGSRAEGRSREDSDLDLAVVPRDNRTRERKLDMLADLARRGFCNVDLVILDRDDLVLKFEAVRCNRLVYQADDFDHPSYFSKIVRLYFDLCPYLEIQREAYKQRLLNGAKRKDTASTE